MNNDTIISLNSNEKSPDIIDSRLIEIEKQIQELTKINRMLSEQNKLLHMEVGEINRCVQLVNRSFLLRPFFLPFKIERKIFHIFRPRLGNLRQYPSRPIQRLKNITFKSNQILPKISLVTPSFNQGHYIEKTIQSVLNQNYPNLEYFIQDGNSSDNTVDVIKNYEAKLTGWKSEKDNGQSQAINLGFAQTSGEIMGWLNSDDLLLPGALAAVANYFNQHPDVDVVYGNRLLIDKNDMEIGRWILPGHNNKALSWVDYIPQETLFWRRSIWEKAGGYIDDSYRFAMDWDLLIRLRDAGANFAHIPRFLGAFRVHEEQKTSSEINEIGFEEMDRIRQRTLGQIPTNRAIRKAILLFMLQHLKSDLIHRIKLRLTVFTKMA